MKTSERRIQNKKVDLEFIGVGVTSLDELQEGGSVDLVIPGKGAFTVKKIQGKYYHVRLYEGSPQ